MECERKKGTERVDSEEELVRCVGAGKDERSGEERNESETEETTVLRLHDNIN